MAICRADGLILDRQQALIDGAAAAGIPVVQVFHVEETGPFSEASGFVTALKPLSLQPVRVFKKARHSALVGTGLDVWLKLRHVDTIVFCGFAGHSVVYTSTLQACDLWYNVVIPRDATCVLVPRVTLPEGWRMEEADEMVEKVTFDILAPIYSHVTNSADVIAHL